MAISTVRPISVAVRSSAPSASAADFAASAVSVVSGCPEMTCRMPVLAVSMPWTPKAPPATLVIIVGSGASSKAPAPISSSAPPITVTPPHSRCLSVPAFSIVSLRRMAASCNGVTTTCSPSSAGLAAAIAWTALAVGTGPGPNMAMRGAVPSSMGAPVRKPHVGPGIRYPAMSSLAVLPSAGEARAAIVAAWRDWLAHRHQITTRWSGGRYIPSPGFTLNAS